MASGRATVAANSVNCSEAETAGYGGPNLPHFRRRLRRLQQLLGFTAQDLDRIPVLPTSVCDVAGRSVGDFRTVLVGELRCGLQEQQLPRRLRAANNYVTSGNSERRRGDSNSRATCMAAGFQDRCNRPLCHPSRVYRPHGLWQNRAIRERPWL